MREARTLTLERAVLRCRILRGAGCRIAFTNGCFDLIHPGHVQVLERAASLGDVLFVGLNTDESVRRLKGEGRPIQRLEARAAVLGALRSVYAVVPFHQDTPLDLVRALRPHVLVKGGDYTPETVVGGDEVDEVVIIPLLEGCSTTGLLRG